MSRKSKPYLKGFCTYCGRYTDVNRETRLCRACEEAGNDPHNIQVNINRNKYGLIFR